MKRWVLGFFVVFSVFEQAARATAMSDQKSRCLNKEETAAQHRAWKKDFERFLQTDDLNPLQIAVLSRGALMRVKVTANRFAAETQVRPQGLALLTADSNALLEVTRNVVTVDQTNDLKEKARQFRDAMERMIDTAQEKFPDCELKPKKESRRNEQTAPRSGVG